MESTYAGYEVQERVSSGQERQRTGAGAPSLWQQLAAAATLESYCQSWLALQCGLLSGVALGMVVTRGTAKAAFTPVAFWPERPHNRQHLAEVTQRAHREGRAVVLPRTAATPDHEAPQTRYHLAYPLQVAGRVHSIIALELAARSAPQLRVVLQQLRWGSAWLRLFLQRQQQTHQRATQEQSQAVLTLLATLLEYPRAQAAAMAFVTAVAERLACDRVSLGFVQRQQVRLQAISHSANFGKKTNLTRALESAMDETLDQATTVTYPPGPETPFRVTRAHEALVRHHGTGAVCSIPLARDGALLGVLTLERPAQRPFAAAEIELCEAVAALAGPVLDTQRRDDRWLVSKVGEALRTQLERLCGPRHGMRKLAVLGVLAVGLLLATFQTDYRVTATTVLEPEVRRVVLAAVDGYIAEAPRRAGELVQAGEVLAVLDERDLKLERLKWRSQREQFAKQYQQALAQRNAALGQMITAQIAQAEAELALVEEHLERTKLRAPFAGLVVSGDLSQAIGAPVERGKVLFEVAPLDTYRVVLEVDERDIAEVQGGHQGHLVLAALSHESWPFTVSKVTPVSTVRDGRNYFRVEARLEPCVASPPNGQEMCSARLRPGMEGIGKITIDRRLLVWMWSHRAVDWLRLQLWSWLP